jgi:molybdate transport system substrate-binding protein
VNATKENPVNLSKILFVGASMLLATATQAEQITVAAAADLKYAMAEIAANFKKANPEDEVNVTFGSSGMFNTQIQHGAPFDLFFSADIAYPRQMVKLGLAASDVRPYAIGRIVLWSSSLDMSKVTLASLAEASITRIAIANPKHAPYGKRAEESLRATGVWDKVEPKLVFGENVSQAAQFVDTGNAQVGIIALSLALNPELQKRGKYILIDDKLHQPLEQGYIITKRATGSKLALRFADYMASPSARAVMTRFGFILPGETINK